MAQIGRLPETTKARFVAAKPEKRCLDLWPLWRMAKTGEGRFRQVATAWAPAMPNRFRRYTAERTPHRQAGPAARRGDL